jgi:hypothetical protein
MTSPADPTPLFQVSYPGTVREALVELHRRGKRIGIGPEILSALRLQQDPLSFGEPNYRLNVFEVRVGVVPPLVIHYGVDLQERLVLVTRVQALPGSDL